MVKPSWVEFGVCDVSILVLLSTGSALVLQQLISPSVALSSSDIVNECWCYVRYGKVVLFVL